MRKYLFPRSAVLFVAGLIAIGGVSARQSLPAQEAIARERPNIVVIMADDLGYGDVSCYGATAVQTPNIDRLAAEGIRFTDGYCSASTCTPTRFSFLTGMYAFRQPGTGVAPPSAPALIQPGTPTIASALQDAGYRTAVIGKWHLGLGGEQGPDWNGELNPGPLEIGFDHCLLLPTTNDRVPQVYVRDHRVESLDPTDPLWVGSDQPSPDHPTGITHRDTLKMDWSHGHNMTIHNGISRIGFYTGGQAARFRDEDLADRWVDAAKEFMRQSAGQPFFLFLASHDIHVPRIPHERFQGATTLGPRGDSIVELDWSVGEIVDALDELGMAENTLVVFCSDNGPVLDDGYRDDAIEKNGDHRPAGPLKGGKYSVYEGGTRTPFITRWPNRILPNESRAVVCTIDLAASCVAIAGRERTPGQFPDSVDVSPALLGDDGASGRHELLQQANTAVNLGFRRGDWKLVVHTNGRANNTVVTEPLGMKPVPKLQLFDLRTDLAEQHDVSAQHTQVVEQMLKRLEAIQQQEQAN